MDLVTLADKDVNSQKTAVLSNEEIDEYLELLTKWKIDEDGRLTTAFELENFMQALELVNEIGGIAEEANHHPDILIYDYKFVGVVLFTHDVDGITMKDIVLAAHIEVDLVGE